MMKKTIAELSATVKASPSEHNRRSFDVPEDEFDEQENKPSLSNGMITIGAYEIKRQTESGKSKSYLRLLLDFIGLDSDMFPSHKEQQKYSKVLHQAMYNNLDIDDETLKLLYNNLFISKTGTVNAETGKENTESSVYQFLSFLIQDDGLDALPSERFIKEHTRKAGRSKHEGTNRVRTRALELAEAQRQKYPSMSNNLICERIMDKVYEYSIEIGSSVVNDPNGTIKNSWVGPYFQIRTEALRLADAVRKDNPSMSAKDICEKIYPELKSFCEEKEKRKRIMTFSYDELPLLGDWVKG